MTHLSRIYQFKTTINRTAARKFTALSAIVLLLSSESSAIINIDHILKAEEVFGGTITQLESAQNTKSYSSYSLLDFSTKFSDVMHYDSRVLNIKDSDDKEEGIRGILIADSEEDSYIELQVFTYDSNYNEKLIYHIKLDSNSSDNFSVGTPIPHEIFSDMSGRVEIINGYDSKAFLQCIQDPYLIPYRQFNNFHKKSLADNYYSEHQEKLKSGLDYEAKSLKETSLGIVSFAIAHGTGALSSKIGNYALSLIIDSPESGQSSEVIDTDEITYTELGTVERKLIHNLHPNDFINPTKSLPVVVRLNLQNAVFFEAKVPGLRNILTPDNFTLWESFSNYEAKQLSARKYWETDPGVLDDLDTELTPPDKVKKYLDLSLHDNDNAHFQITVNPDSRQTKTYEICAPTDEKLQDPDWIQPTIDLKIGDHVSMEVAVPLDKGVEFDPENPSHYPRLSGFPFAWMAFFAGEVLYQCEPSIQPGEWRPWLGYDLQGHGAVLRKYPEGYDPKFYDWHVDTSHEDYVVFIWTAKITRRTDSTKETYVAPYHWSKTKTLKDGTLQRNNRSAGLNMEILNAWQNSSPGSDAMPDFSHYQGSDFVSGIDSDEFLYLRNTNGNITDIINLLEDEWKNVPDYESENPINDIVTAYRKNRIWNVDGLDYRDVYGPHYFAANYEIQDQGTSPEKPYGIKVPCKARGNFKVEMPKAITTKLNPIMIGIDTRAPLLSDRGFYGNIQSPDCYPAVWEGGLIYTFDCLDNTQLDNYAVSFIYEDEFGRRKYLNYFSSLAPENYRLQILREGKWTVRLPSILGLGYYSINLWHKNSNYEASWTRIGGKELFDIDLRYLFAPSKIIGDHEFGLNENPGDGKNHYRIDFLDQKRNETDHIAWEKHYLKPYLRTYSFNKNASIGFRMMDKDPHTFFNDSTEWHLSERFQAKRLQGNTLDSSSAFCIYNYDTGNPRTENILHQENANLMSYKFNDEGNYYLEATYKNTSDVGHKIIITDRDDRLLHEKYMQADISRKPLSELELDWLTEAGVSIGSYPSTDWYILSIDNIYSRYKYVTGPRVHADNPDQTNRYNPANDYNDSYIWKINTANTTEVPHTHYSLDQHSPSGLTSAIINYNDGKDWLPDHFVRHTSEVINGVPMPNDILNGSISVSQFDALTDAQETKIMNLFTDAPEPWQIRLPLIPFVFNANPYVNERLHQPDYVTFYRARNDTKVLFNMYAFFDNQNGAFSGNPLTAMGDDYSDENLLDKGIHLNLMTDTIKLKRAFFQDLATGRKIIVSKDVKRVNVCNVERNHVVIADSTTDNSSGF